jgi:hypothetical protein
MIPEKTLAEAILRHADAFEWSIQGLGMLRTYIDAEKTLRLHVWSREHAVPGVSQMHTHPWHMKSHVLAGVVMQYRYTLEGTEAEVPDREVTYRMGLYNRQSLKCGVGGHLEEAPDKVWLRQGDFEQYNAGEAYTQRADEIHVSNPLSGTVTLLDRKVPEGANPDLAYVFWPANEEWVSAEPRPATDEERDEIIGVALETWF